MPNIFRGKWHCLILFGLLAAYTLCTLDGEDVAPRIISAAVFLLAAFHLISSRGQSLTLNIPIVCLLLMACYGVAQTLWSPQKIVYNGWIGVLFWLTAAAITFVATQLFRNPQAAASFRRLFVIFCSAVCVLDLLEQATHTNKYYWLIPSRYAAVSGPFAYWNNFAQFVELCLPITLWLAVGRRTPEISYLLLSGLQIGAVAGTGSRAGSALVAIELIAVMLIAYSRNRRKVFLYAAASMLLASALFVYAAGFDALSQKLQRRDQLAVRREINQSSLAMIRARPFTGWGLGTYVPVYRMFARYDDGSYVNRAHNDWLEWTAEGGIFFSALMLIVFLWSIRPAVRSVWGIGVISVCLHALVDYPFARFGVCGWYFALIGMLAACDHEQIAKERVKARSVRDFVYRRRAA
jgi:O-antigen ligase